MQIFKKNLCAITEMLVQQGLDGGEEVLHLLADGGRQVVPAVARLRTVASGELGPRLHVHLLIFGRPEAAPGQHNLPPESGDLWEVLLLLPVTSCLLPLNSS